MAARRPEFLSKCFLLVYGEAQHQAEHHDIRGQQPVDAEIGNEESEAEQTAPEQEQTAFGRGIGLELAFLGMREGRRIAARQSASRIAVLCTGWHDVLLPCYGGPRSWHWTD